MKKTLSLLVAILICTLLTTTAAADELSDVQNQIGQKNSAYASAQAALEKVKKDLASIGSVLNGTQAQLDSANSKVVDARAQLASIQKTIEEKQSTLEYLIKVRNQQIRQMYTYPAPNSFELLLLNNRFADLANTEIYQNRITVNSQDLIRLVNNQLSSFKQTETEFTKTKADLEAVAAQIAAQVNALKNSYYSTSSQKNSLNNQIKQINISLTDLNAQQRELIALKYGITSSPIGSVPPTGDPNSQKDFDPGFRPAFAVFSFGAYTHRNGMSQYGALGRANGGQIAEQILAAYYPSTALNKSYPTQPTIAVSGTNTYGQIFDGSKQYAGGVCYEYYPDGRCKVKGGIMDFGEYLKHLYEVPASWPAAVLRAQAVAARSFAVGKASICPGQSCQEVKWEINATAWQQAVDATAGWVLTGGSGSFQYSSTSGGYLNTSGWDTNCGNMNCWLSGGAYESIGSSPWFYKGWYKDLSGATCGRSSPWITQTEFADMLNAWVVYTKGNPTDKSRVISIDYNSCFGGSANPYSIDEMRARADQLGGAYTTISTAAAVYSPTGYTSIEKFVTNRGYLEINGQEFENILDLRLPGKLAAKSPLYNIESKF